MCAPLALISISLFAARPARAQYLGEQFPGGYLSATACDAQGVPLNPHPYPDSDGFYTMTGTQNATLTRTYPKDMVDAGLAAWPGGYQAEWLSAVYPIYQNAPNAPTLGPLYNGLGYWAGIDSAHEVDASNNYGFDSWTYSLSSNGVTHTGVVNGSVTADVTGHLASYFKVTWYPSSSTSPAPMPDHLDLLLRTNVTAEASVDPGAAIPSDGLWALATATDGPPFGETASAAAGLDGGGVIVGAAGPSRVVGYHLVRVAVDPVTQIATVFLDGTMHYTANDGVLYGILPNPFDLYGQVTNGPTSAHAASGVSAGVKPDNRGVIITSPIETSYYKGALDIPHGTDRYEHIRNADGSMAVDSVVRWTSVPGTTWVTDGPGASSGIPFTASAANFTQPTYAWSLSGGGQFNSQTQNYLGSNVSTVPVRLSFPDDNSVARAQSLLQVTVTDSDQATAANTYNVTWHLPYEQTAFLGSVPMKTKLNKLYGPIHQGDSSDVQISAARDIDIAAGLEAAGAVAGAVGQEEVAGILEIVGKLAKVSDAKYHYGGENVRYGTQNGQDKWAATLNNPDWSANVSNRDLLNYIDPRTGAYDGWVFFDLEIWETKLYHHMTWAADKYTLNGYDSSGHTLYADPVDKVESEPYYQQVSSPTPH